jgi:hypothetical protein
MRKGTHHSEATKARISTAKSGKPQNPNNIVHQFAKGQTPWNKGKPASEEVRERLSKTQFQKGQSTWNKGKKASEEVRKKLSEAHKGHVASEETKQKMRAAWKNRSEEATQKIRQASSAANKGRELCEDTRQKIANAMKGNTHFAGRKHTEESKRKISESRLGEKHWAWRGGVSFEPYCPKFNGAKKEEIREKFGRKCFYCGLQESENKSKSGKVRKLSVHHVHYSKEEGCNGEMMVLLPLCIQCHAKTTSGDRAAWMQKLSEKLQCYEGDSS